jgi:mannose-6-phosphate isomerase-like protein (cupin superfamily)
MRKLRLTELPDNRDGHFLAGVVPGEFLAGGGLSFKKPNVRTHDHDAADGSDRHVHSDCEVFVILQGRAVMEVDGARHDLVTGDVVVVEPGEDHHLVSDAVDPSVNLWLHAGPSRHPDQEG